MPGIFFIGAFLRSGFILSIIPLSDSKECHSHPEHENVITPGQISVFDVLITKEGQNFALPIVVPVLLILFLIILPTSLCVYFILRQILNTRTVGAASQ